SEGAWTTSPWATLGKAPGRGCVAFRVYPRAAARHPGDDRGAVRCGGLGRFASSQRGHRGASGASRFSDGARRIAGLRMTALEAQLTSANRSFAAETPAATNGMRASENASPRTQVTE